MVTAVAVSERDGTASRLFWLHASCQCHGRSPPSPTVLRSSMSLVLPSLKSPYLSLTAPLTIRSLLSIRTALQTFAAAQARAHPVPSIANAAVLVPLANVDDRPSLLLEVRAAKLRSHGGEVRCGD